MSVANDATTIYKFRLNFAAFARLRNQRFFVAVRQNEEMIMRRLPPLRSLEAFLRVAKLGSAKAAASELALSPPALSRRIKGT